MQEKIVNVADLNPGDSFRWEAGGQVDTCHKASRLFKPNGKPSDKCYLSVGQSSVDCIVVYPATDRQVYLVEA